VGVPMAPLPAPLTRSTEPEHPIEKRAEPAVGSGSGSSPVHGAPSSPNASAHAAFSARDGTASIQYHQARQSALAAGSTGTATEKHGSGGYLKSIVYGGLDGIITAFALTASVSGANLSAAIVLILGIASLLANGIGMGVGDALSEQAETDFNNAERAREKWEMDNHLEGEVEEMVAIYTAKKVSEQDARTMLGIMTKYPDVFLDHMMCEELRLLPPEADASPWKNGVATFCSFVMFGFVPLIPYVIAQGVSMSATLQFEIAIGLTGFILLVLGAVKGYLVDSTHFVAVWKSALTTLGLGGIAAAVAYLVGFLLQKLAPAGALASSS